MLERGLCTAGANHENVKIFKIVYLVGWSVGCVTLVALIEIVKIVYFAGRSVDPGQDTSGENLENVVRCWLMSVLGT